jgi:hypothetical protein
MNINLIAEQIRQAIKPLYIPETLISILIGVFVIFGTYYFIKKVFYALNGVKGATEQPSHLRHFL